MPYVVNHVFLHFWRLLRFLETAILALRTMPVAALFNVALVADLPPKTDMKLARNAVVHGWF